MASNNTVAWDDPLSLVCKLCDKTYQHKDSPLMLPCLHSFCKPCLTQYIEKEDSADNKMSCPTCNDRFPHPKDINQFPVNLRLLHLAKTTMYEKQAEMKCSIEESAEQDKAELQQLTNGVDDALNTMDQTLQQIQDTRDKVKVSAKEATKWIDRMCDDLILTVEDRREVLKRKCQKIAEGKDDVLSNQMIEVERMRKKLGYALLHAKNAVRNHSDDEIVSVKKVIEDRVARLKQLHQHQSMELQEDGHFGIELGETVSLVERISQEVGEFANIPDCQESIVSELVVPTAIINKEKKIILCFRNEAGNPVQGKCHFQYRLSKVGEDPDEYIPPKVTITQGNNDGTATLGFTPDQPGEYELTIKVRNKPIASPFKITVVARESIRDYSNFGNMPATYKNVGGHKCFSVAVHDNGTVYASDYSNNRIKVFRPDGTEGQIGSSADNTYFLPRGITIIGDTIYVVSNGNKMVKMYSTDGRYIGGFGGSGSGNDQFRSPYGICTDGNGRVLVADKSGRRIQVFSSEGDFIKSIPCIPNCGFPSAPFDVAVDPVGNIHVALNSQHRIAVYSPQDGRQIDTYNVGGIVQGPVSIFIDSEGNRFIGCNSGHKVLIVDSTGTLIASRHVEGYPWGVAVDKNGLIYVTKDDPENDCLLIL